MRTVSRGGPPQAPKVDRQAQFLRAMSVAKELGLSQEDRYAYAEMCPSFDRDKMTGSWKELESEQLTELILMLEGFVYGIHLMIQNGSLQTWPFKAT